jgi:hypothetical protein
VFTREKFVSDRFYMHITLNSVVNVPNAHASTENESNEEPNHVSD